jgi:AraC-like DNA-binding protein
MKSKNICKIIPSEWESRLTVSQFILEIDEQTMMRVVELTTHRVLLVFEGEGRLHFDRESVEVTSGSLVFGFSGEQFFADPKSPMQYLYISFSGARADDLLRRFSVAAKNRVFTGYDGMIPLWHESLSRASALTVDLAAESMLLYTFSRLSASEAEYGGLVGQLVEISEEQFSDPALSVNTLAQMLGYNAKYISHIFKEKMGMGYSEYLRSLRIKYAVSLFDHGIESVKNVALLSGFTDPLYFSTVFKKTLGISPTEYKKK